MMHMVSLYYYVYSKLSGGVYYLLNMVHVTIMSSRIVMVIYLYIVLICTYIDYIDSYNLWYS